LVFDEAENRMWTVMAVAAAQLGKVEWKKNDSILSTPF
jgi:hypothetical protein